MKCKVLVSEYNFTTKFVDDKSAIKVSQFPARARLDATVQHIDFCQNK